MKFLTTEQIDDIVTAIEFLDRNLQTSGFGFTRFQSTYRTLQAYGNRKLGVVVKQQNCILDPRTPDNVRVPTIYLKNGWVIQPFVKKVKLKRACELIRASLSESYKRGVYPDLHTGNVGWYQGKPVMFDW
jgi:hypothetical protein